MSATITTISPEEEKELAALKIDREVATRQLKIEEFKKLPSNLRQHVVDDIMWHDEAEKISHIHVPMTQRELELANKQPFTIGISSYPNGWITVGSKIPQGLSKEDLIKAHNDASLEDLLDE